MQNRTPLMALSRTLPRLAEVRVFDFRPELARAFCQEMAGQVPRALRTVGSAREALDGTDVFLGAKHVCPLAVNEGVIPESRIHGELGEIVVGRKPGRETAAEPILFNRIGLPIHDVGEATRIYRSAKGKGIGRVLPL